MSHPPPAAGCHGARKPILLRATVGRSAIIGPVSTSSPLRLVLFDIDGTLIDHDGAAAAAVQQWLIAMSWADAGTIAGLVAEWDEIAERHFPAYRARLTTFQGQRRLRLRDFLPRVGIDASTWSDGRLDDLFNTYLVAYEAAWRAFADAEPVWKLFDTWPRSRSCPTGIRSSRSGRFHKRASAVTSTSC